MKWGCGCGWGCGWNTVRGIGRMMRELKVELKFRVGKGGKRGAVLRGVGVHWWKGWCREEGVSDTMNEWLVLYSG